VRSRTLAGGDWSALSEAFFYFEIPLRVTEIMYHPRAPGEGSEFDADDFEFIELQNIAGAPLDLNGIRLTGGIDFDFSESPTALGPGEVVVVVKSLAAFAARYPFLGANVAGEYSGNLRNLGDAVRLEGRAGEPILDFDYSDRWFPASDGEGYSLTIADPQAPAAAWGEPSSWRLSAGPDGSPGIAEGGPPPEGGMQRPGNINQDLRLDISDGVALLGHLFLGSGPALPCEGESVRDGGNFTLFNVNGDASIDLTDAVGILNFLFLSGPPPALGRNCVRITGCSDACAP
jgi:hypothetical protein